MVRIISGLLLAFAILSSANYASAQVIGDIRDGGQHHGGGHGGGGWGPGPGHGGGGHGGPGHGGGHGGPGGGHGGGGHGGPGWERYNFVFEQIDNNGCRRCQVRADQWRTNGCRDMRAYDHLCNRNTVGMRLACRQPYTRDNDYVYTCRRY